MRKIISFFIVLFFAGNAFAANLTEEQKIESLLNSLVNDQVTFIRNGEEHNGIFARQHLTEKLATSKDIKTAKDFIEQVGSISSHTDQPYVIRLENGNEIDARKWFLEKLADLESVQ